MGVWHSYPPLIHGLLLILVQVLSKGYIPQCIASVTLPFCTKQYYSSIPKMFYYLVFFPFFFEPPLPSPTDNPSCFFRSKSFAISASILSFEAEPLDFNALTTSAYKIIITLNGTNKNALLVWPDQLQVCFSLIHS